MSSCLQRQWWRRQQIGLQVRVATTGMCRSSEACEERARLPQVVKKEGLLFRTSGTVGDVLQKCWRLLLVIGTWRTFRWRSDRLRDAFLHEKTPVNNYRSQTASRWDDGRARGRRFVCLHDLRCRQNCRSFLEEGTKLCPGSAHACDGASARRKRKLQAVGGAGCLAAEQRKENRERKWRWTTMYVPKPQYRVR